jgi:hypothetical protein
LEYEQIKACPDIREVRKQYAKRYFIKEGSLEPRPLKPLDTNLGKAIKKRKLREKIYESLPKIDCGVCGSPTCLAFAEDVVISDAELADCIFMPLKKVKNLPNDLQKSLNKDRLKRPRKARDKNPKKVRRTT